jgi:hypothetical protein
MKCVQFFYSIYSSFKILSCFILVFLRLQFSHPCKYKGKTRAWKILAANRFLSYCRVSLHVRFEVLTASTMKSPLFRDIAARSPVKVNRCLQEARRGMGNLPLDMWFSHQWVCWLLAWLTLRPWRHKQYFPPKCQLTFAGIHDFISQKIGP